MLSGRNNFGGDGQHIPTSLMRIESGFLDFAHINRDILRVFVHLAWNRGANREFEALNVSVAEFDGPQYGVGGHQRDHRPTKRGEISVAPNLDHLLGANFHATVALPTLLGLLIERFAGVRVERHQVVGANIHAGCFFLAHAPIAFFGDYKTRYWILLKKFSVSIAHFNFLEKLDGAGRTERERSEGSSPFQMMKNNDVQYSKVQRENCD